MPQVSLALALPLLTLFTTAATAGEPCKAGLIGELPVTMEGMQPIVHAAINGTDEPFIADSGAFYSMLTPTAAAELHLTVKTTQAYLTGVGGIARVGITTAKKFTIFKVDVHDVEFLVGGENMRRGEAVGLLGQNVFRIGDVEYDLANGMIRILKTVGDCSKTALAYWVKGVSYSEIEIDFADRMRPHTTGSAYVNGSKIRVAFDTGAGASYLSLSAAKRAGVTPDSPGVKPGGSASGIGSGLVRTWIAPFASFKIGDEEVRNTHLRIADERLANWDMLIGPDFFLSHHILVASSQRKLYFTYNGGPVFNLTTMPESAPAAAGPNAVPGGTEPAVPAPASGAASAQPAEEPPDAAGYARRGSASAARRDYQHAIADLTRAIELAPGEATYHYERGMAHWQNKEPDKALEDFGAAIKIKPDDVPALVARAELRAGRRDPADSIRPDLDAADRASSNESEVRLALGHLYEYVHDYPAAIAQYDRWIGARNADDVEMPVARNARCWVRALAGQELDRALADCSAAVHARPKVAAFLDSRGLVYLRQGKYDKAIADYDAALALNPKIAWSLYGRGLAKQHQGHGAAAQADIAAATALAPKIAAEAASHGIVP